MARCSTVVSGVVSGVVLAAVLAFHGPPGVAGAAAAEALRLDGGFFPDPRTVEVAVVADRPAAELVRGCPGEVAGEPALVLTLERASMPLRFYATGDGIAGLVLATPDGIHHCGGLDAAGVAVLRLGAAADGDYHLWPAVAETGAEVAVRIAVSELELSAADLLPARAALGTTAPPAAGRHALPEVGPLELAVDFGGSDPASLAGPHCAGRLDASRPDVVLSVEHPEPVLHFDVWASVDTTLVVIDPAGGVHCDDDSFDYDPAVAVAPAPAGDYAVWIGLYGGGADEPAQLTIGREAPERGADGWAAEDVDGDWNPFAGRDIQSARAALDILLDEMGMGGIVAYESIEEPGPEAVTLHGVVLADPDEPSMRLEVGRIVISDLDLEGLGTADGPKHFAIALEAIDYASLVEGLRAFAMLPLPALDGRPTLTLAFSLLPAGEGRMTGTFLGQLDRQIGLGFEVTASPEPGATTVDPFAAEEALADSFVFELMDWGYLGALMREQAAAEGQSLEAFIAEGQAEMREALAPMTPGSPAAAVHDAVAAMLADLDRPGVLRFSLVSDRPRPLEDLFEALAVAETLDADGLTFAITYLPME